MILNYIAVKLRENLHAMDENRDNLRQQWKTDEHLQLLAVENNLVELNRYFQGAENGIEDALDVIEKRLSGRRQYLRVLVYLILCNGLHLTSTQ